MFFTNSKNIILLVSFFVYMFCLYWQWILIFVLPKSLTIINLQSSNVILLIAELVGIFSFIFISHLPRKLTSYIVITGILVLSSIILIVQLLFPSFIQICVLMSSGIIFINFSWNKNFR